MSKHSHKEPPLQKQVNHKYPIVSIFHAIVLIACVVGTIVAITIGHV